MQSIAITPIKNSTWGGVYTRIEQAMAERGVDIIGEPDYRIKNADKYKNKHGEVRPASLDMTSESRAYRTLMVRRFNNEQIEVLHKYEALSGYFTDVGIFARRVFKIDFNPEVMSEERLEALKDFNNRMRPDLGSIYGCKIPAYYPPHMQFDGMKYHSAWDKKVMFAEFVLPDLKVKIKVKAKSYLGE